MGILTDIKSFFSPPSAPESRDGLVTIDVNDLAPSAYAGQTVQSPWEESIWDGGKFAGGFGATQLLQADYWTLRQRSSQLFTENLYARGLIRRLVTNIINTGLSPEACPEESILGLAEDSLADWTEDVETRFGLWAKSPAACSFSGEMTFGKIQQVAKMEALVAGDVLTVLRTDRRTGLPRVQLINGANVRTPWSGEFKLRTGHTIEHGVEFDTVGRVSAYWVMQRDGQFKRLAAYGEKSGRRLAWLVFGTDRRLDDVRGQPLLAIVLQSLKEIDRYRDSVQRKAVVNSILALFIKKDSEKMGSRPMTGGATRRGSATVSDGTTQGSPRKFNTAQYIPGLVMDELQVGEEPILKGGEGTDTNFGTFEEAIIQSVAWANEVPPEILRLAFSNNYSASQAAINEFKIYINKEWSNFGEEFCAPIYQDWLISSALTRRIRADGLLDAWRDPARFDILAAWVSADWYGSIKPSTDMLKTGKGSKLLVDEGWSTNAREARVTTGTKFSKNIKRLARENRQKAEAARPILELQNEYGGDATTAALAELDDKIDEILESRDNG